MLPRLVEVPGKLLIEPTLLPQTPESANVCQSEVEKEKVFVPHVGHRVTAILERHATAIPIVGGLRADELQQLAAAG